MTLDLQSVVYLTPQMNPNDLFFTFDEWYQDHQRWRCTSYHHLYYKKQEEKYHSQSDKSGGASAKTGSDDEVEILYFIGVDDMDSLKKRYRDLLKIYHPDNQNGDTTATQKIQTEYQYLFSKFA